MPGLPRSDLLAGYRKTADSVIAALSLHPKVIGVAVCGSVVTGDVWEGSDIDIFAVMRDVSVDWHCLPVRHGDIQIHLQLLSEEFLLEKSVTFRGGILSQVLARSEIVYDPENVLANGIPALASYPEDARIQNAIRHLTAFLAEYNIARKALQNDLTEDAFLHANLAFRELAYVQYARQGAYPQRTVIEELIDVSPKVYKGYVWFVHGRKKVSDRIRRSFALFERTLEDIMNDLGPAVIAGMQECSVPITNEVISALPSIDNDSADLGLFIDRLVKRHVIREDKRVLVLDGVKLEGLSETLFGLF